MSGTIRSAGNPVSGVSVQINSPEGSQTVITGADGAYSYGEIPYAGWVQIFVRPPVAMRLAFRNFGSAPLTADLVKDFDLEAGYRLQGEFNTADGTLFSQSFWLGLVAADITVPSDEWLGVQAEGGRFDLVLPPSRYLLKLNAQPFPYFMPHIKTDLRTNDVIGLLVTLLNERPIALPTTPPNASLITIGSANNAGVATVIGLAGTVDPLSDVILVNLNAKNFAHSIADSSGGFSANIFAPPGSALMIKYDPDGWRTQMLLHEIQVATSAVGYTYINPLPGTILNVGAPAYGQSNFQDFTAVGGFTEDPSTISRGLWAGWWLSGRIEVPSGPPPLRAGPGQLVSLSNLVLHVTSPAFDCTESPSIQVNMDIVLRYLFAQDGSSHPWGIWFTSHLFTPTGMPIEHEGGGESIGVRHASFTSFTCDGAHSAVSVQLQTDFIVPTNLPEGTYQIQTWIESGDIPKAEVSAVPTVFVWYHSSQSAILSMLTVGDAEVPRIPWTLLGDYPLEGLRGVGARQDAGIYSMPDRVVTQPQHFIIPREDARTGEPLVYKLEPGSHWISASDRRFPNPPSIPLDPTSGTLEVFVEKPDGSEVLLGPVNLNQTSQRTPTNQSGDEIAEGTGQIADLYHLTTRTDSLDYSFDQYGHHVITLDGTVADIHGRVYNIYGIFDVYVARLLDLDSAQLPTTPYVQGDAFASGLHLYPPVPAEVSVEITHMPYSDPTHALTTLVTGRANEYGYFQPPIGTEIRFETPGEFRVDLNAAYTSPDGVLWMGSQTWGSVIEGTTARIEAHGRRGMDYHDNTIDDMPAWFEVFNLPADKVGIEVYYPYFSGDIHWGNEDNAPGDSIHSIITIRDLAPTGTIYDLIIANYPRSRNGFRWPPDDTSLAGLDKRLAVGEAPLFLSTSTGRDAGVFPEEIDQWGYAYLSSERPDVRVREIVTEDNMGTAYWRFNDTYNLQVGEGAMGDLPGDLKWEFGGAVYRVPGEDINEYAVYSSLWVLLPIGDPVGARITPPFQFAAGGMNGGPILTLNGQHIDMLFLPKGVRPGDVLKVGDVVSFSGHVGPPLDSRVDLTITSPGGVVRSRSWHANKIGWLYDPTFDFMADEPGRWIVDVNIEHDRPYLPTGLTPASHNSGTVLGTKGRYSFYVVEPLIPALQLTSPQPGFITWSSGHIEPIYIQGIAPVETEAVHFTIHDKGIVMGQGEVIPEPNGEFTITYDAFYLNQIFPMVSLTAHEGRWEGLADEVKISLLAIGSPYGPSAATVTLIGEEIFLKPVEHIYLPLVERN
ncbi:MAG: hypothetical protein IH585_19130 [Anaerolineaceae bacterium]|nr:hypothetical protein [Anaerolineaceae bacterium]